MSLRDDFTTRQTGRRLSRVVFTEDQIQSRVLEMARGISDFYSSEDDILMLGLLKGSFIFLADLVRRIQHPLKVDFLVVSSYGNSTKTSAQVKLLYAPEASLEGRSVILVEDIIDSGTTLNWLIPLLEKRGPKSLEICSLLHKRVADLDREPRWLGFDAPKDFLVGYGLDYSEDFRHLPYIGSL
jgi:hypoxanthine phosphoribosyltransferase